MSKIHGYGLFSSLNHSPGDIVGSLDGQIIPATLHFRYKKFPEWNALNGDRLLVRLYRSKYSYINHSKTPNLKSLPERGLIVVLRAVKPGDEFCLDYTDEPLPTEYKSRKGWFL